MTPPAMPFSVKGLLIRLGVAVVLIVLLALVTIELSTRRLFPPEAAPARKQAQASTPSGNKQPKPAQAKPTGKASPANHRAQASLSGGAVSAKAGGTSKATSAIFNDFATLAGVTYTDRPEDARRLRPRVEVLDAIAQFRPGYAIWGALGQDHAGQVWIGTSGYEGSNDSARLIRFNPGRDQMIDQGLVMDKLREAGQASRATRQLKIHSRIVQGGDGCLYFSSMDEQDEGASARRRSPSFLWRVRPPAYEWELLFEAPEELMAVAGYGSAIYTLGHPGHVLYRFDTDTGQHQRVEVGSVAGHVSRNFVVDLHGQAYVPRVKPGLLRGDPPVVELVQYSRELREVNATPMSHYLTRNPADSHGIIAMTTLADHSIIIATHEGYLYRISPAAKPDLPSKVTPVGWFHPEGPRYTPTMHTIDGLRYLVGVAKVAKLEEGLPAFEWLTYDLWLNEAYLRPMDIPSPAEHGPRNLLLYGSMVRDKAGRFYLAGSHLNAAKPMLIRIALEP